MSNDPLYDLHKQWQSMGRPASADDERKQLVSRLRHKACGPLTARLRRRFRLLTVVSAYLVITGVSIPQMFHVRNLALQIVFTAVGLICLAVNLANYLDFRDSNFYGKTCVEAAREVRRLRRRIQMFRIWGMAIALPVVWFFLYVVARGDVWIWVSGGIGGLIGGAIGIVIERRINRDIDALLSSFTDAADGADGADTCPD